MLRTRVSTVVLFAAACVAACDVAPVGNLSGGLGGSIDLAPNCGASPPHMRRGWAIFECGALECELDWADCDHDETNGCETSVADDAASCGACGNTCVGGRTCRIGSCFDVDELTTVTTPSFGGFHGRFALGGDRVYVATMSSIARAPKWGGDPEEVASGSTFAVVADADGAYWIDGLSSDQPARLLFWPRDRAAAIVLASFPHELPSVIGAGAGGTFIARGASDTDAGTRCPILHVANDGSVRDAVCDPRARAVTVGADALYWVSAGALVRMPLWRGPSVDVAEGFGDGPLAIGPRAIYGVSASGALRFDASDGSVRLLPLPSGKIAALAADVDGLFVVIGGSDAIVRVPDIGSSAMLAGAQDWASDVAVDDAYVYWATIGSSGETTVRRMARSPH